MLCDNCILHDDGKEEGEEETEEEVFEMENLFEEIKARVEILENAETENTMISSIARDFKYFLEHDVNIPAFSFIPFIHLISKWADNADISILFIYLVNNFPQKIEEMGENEEFYLISELPKYKLSGWIIEFLSLLIHKFPAIADKLFVAGLMNEALGNAFVEPFSSNSFSLHFDLIIKVFGISNIPIPDDFLKDTVMMISTNIHAFAEMFIDYAENKVHELDSFKVSMSGKSMSAEEMESYHKEIDRREDELFRQGNMSHVISTLLAACSKNEEYFACAESIIGELIPCIKYFDYRCISSFYLFVAYAKKAGKFVVPIELLDEVTQKFINDKTPVKSNPIFQSAATFFREVTSDCPQEILSRLIEMQVLDKFKQIITEGNTNQKSSSLVFFINLLKPEFYEIMESEINDGLIYLLIETSLVSVASVREDVFTAINGLIDFLVKKSLWSPDSPVVEQIEDSAFGEIEDDDLTIAEKQLRKFLEDLQNDDLEQ